MPPGPPQKHEVGLSFECHLGETIILDIQSEHPSTLSDKIHLFSLRQAEETSQHPSKQRARLLISRIDVVIVTEKLAPVKARCMENAPPRCLS